MPSRVVLNLSIGFYCTLLELLLAILSNSTRILTAHQSNLFTISNRSQFCLTFVGVLDPASPDYRNMILE